MLEPGTAALFDTPLWPDSLDGEPAGFASASVLLHLDKNPQHFINEVDVREGIRRNGIGRPLVARLVEAARIRGCDYAWLGTDRQRERQRLFQVGAGGMKRWTLRALRMGTRRLTRPSTRQGPRRLRILHSATASRLLGAGASHNAAPVVDRAGHGAPTSPDVSARHGFQEHKTPAHRRGRGSAGEARRHTLLRRAGQATLRRSARGVTPMARATSSVSDGLFKV